MDDLTLRCLDSHADYAACVQLQRDVWGEAFADVVPATILMVAQRVGGVSAGAFDADGRLVGFVFGISGVRAGTLAHWSDMLAVRSEVRRGGLGVRLKRFQRDLLLDRGITRAYWTYDPLIAGNAHLNLTRLGAVPIEYVANMYGETGSTLHRGLETDRVVVEWRLDDPQVARALDAAPAATVDAGIAGMPLVNAGVVGTPLVNAGVVGMPLVNADPVSRPGEAALPTAAWVRVAVPPDIVGLKAARPDDARAWQRATRRAFSWYLANGYRVAGFHRASMPAPCYVMTTDPKK